jgi:hypothetical protein
MDCTARKIPFTYVFIFWELRGLSPNFLIPVSVNDLYILRIGPFSRIGRQILEIYKYFHRYMSVGTRRQNIIVSRFGNNSFISGNT